MFEDLRNAYDRTSKYFIQTRAEMRAEEDIKKLAENTEKSIKEMEAKTQVQIEDAKVKMLDAFLIG